MGQKGGNGSPSKAQERPLQRRSAWLQLQLAGVEPPARMVGLFAARALLPHDIERLIEVCLRSMREEDAGASLLLAPLAEPPLTWKITVAGSAAAAPHDCTVRVHAIGDPGSPHRGLLQHIALLDEEMGRATRESVEPAETYLVITSGRLDEQGRIHAFQNLVALFTTALGALIVDPAAAMVTMDPGEWADAMEMSLEVEDGMKLLRKK